jgi:AraC family transcriptional activator of mtrCDE
MQLAASLLTAGSSIGRVADDVGYRSEAAFQRAFKKYVGVTCGEWRKRAQHARATTASA